MTPTSQRFGLTLALVGVSSLLFACGDSGSPVDNPTDTSTVTSSESSDPDESSDETLTSDETTSSSSSSTATQTTSTSSTSHSGSDSDSSDSSSTPSGVCEGDFRCVDKPADGWQGPVARIEIESPDGVAEVGSCRAPYSFHDDFAFDKPIALPQTCQCSCGKASGMSCSDAEAAFFEIGDSDCSELVSSQKIGLCTDVTGAGDAAEYVRIKAPEVKAGTGACPPVGPTLTASDEPEWTLAQRTCRPFEPSTCENDSGLCVPNPPAATYKPGVCIWQAGEQTCPAGDYSQRWVRYRAIDDQRSCGACSCSAPSTAGLSCKSRIEFYLDDACDGQKETVDTFATCTKLFANDGQVPTSAQLIVSSITGASTCTASGGALVGGPVAKDAVTYCCTPQ